MPVCTDSATNHNPAMPSSTSTNVVPHSNTEQSQHPTQTQGTYQPTKSFLGFFQWLFLHMLRVLVAPIRTTFRDSQTITDAHKQQASVANANSISRLPGTLHHDSFNTTSMRAEGRDTISTSVQPAVAPVATLFQDARNVNMRGNPTLMNIGMNTGNLTTVNNYGGSHGLEKLEKYVSFAALHDSAEQDPNRRCHPGTRRNILTRFRDWIGNPNSTNRIFWLHGPAGAGKSAIAQTIAHTYNQGEVAATFFFYRSDPSRNNGNQLFPTIAWQLAFSIAATKDYIVHALDKTPHLPTKGVETQFEQLVAQPFQPTNDIVSQMPQPAPVVIIDGIDECSDEQLQRRILAVIGNAVKDCCVPLRFIICSRLEYPIEETLGQFQNFTLQIDLADTATLDDSNRDIEKYLVDKFSEISSKRGLYSTWPGPEIVQEFVFKSSGNFIFAFTVMMYISDEDYDPETQLDIIRNLKPRGKMSPFALLDELYLEILKRQLDQDFLKIFLAVLVGRSSIEQDGLHEDDAMLMNVSEKGLHIKLRRMRSLLKFKPFIDVYHKSFLDFLQDPSRSGEYYVSKRGGQKRYLELIVDSVVRHVSIAIEQPHNHEACRLSPQFKYIVRHSPPKLVLPVEDWEDALKPLLDLQDNLLKTSKPQPCRVTQVMRELLLYLVILQGKPQPIAAAQIPESNMNEIVTDWSYTLMAEAEQSRLEMDLDRCLSVLLSCLYRTDSKFMMEVDTAIFACMSSLLVFDHAEIVARICSVTSAQKLIDIIDLLINNETFLSQYGPNAARKAAYLGSEIFARVPLLPRSPFLNKPACCIDSLGYTIELGCQSVFISKILDHDYILPVLGIYDKPNQLQFGYGNITKQNESVNDWLKTSSPKFITRIRAMLEIARTIRYIHSMDVILYSDYIESKYLFLDSNLRANVLFIGFFAWWITGASNYGHEASPLLASCTYESNVSAFGDLFNSVCFEGHSEDLSDRLIEDAMKLIDRCRAKGSKNRPAMAEVVQEMERWNLT